MAGRTLTIDITTADAQTLAALKRVQKQLGVTGTEADKASKRSLSLGQALGGLAIGAGLSKAIGEFEEAEKVGRQTEAVIRSTGNAAQVSAEQQDKMVDSLSRLAAVDDEVVAGGANILRTFTAVKGEAFGPALASALDLSAALGKDLQSSVMLVGKALNDPVKGMTAMTRAGIQFTAQQKEQVKALMASGDTLGAQKVILKELETQFGGQAEAAATDSAKMRVAFDNAAESAGEALAPGLTMVAGAAERVAAGVQALPVPLQQAAFAGGALAIVGPRIYDGWKSAVDMMGNAQGRSARLIDSLGGVSTVAPVAGTAVAGLAIGGAMLADTFAKIDARAKEAETAIANLAEESARSGREISDILAEGAVRDFAADFDEELSALGVTWDELVQGVTGSQADFDALFNRLAAGGFPVNELNIGLGELRNQFTGASERAGTLNKIDKELDDTTKSNVVSFDDLADTLDGVGVAFDRAFAPAVKLQEAQEELADAMVDQESASENLASALESVEAAEDSVTSAKESHVQAQRAVVDAAASEQDAIEGVSDALEDQSDAEADLAAKRQEAAGDSDAMRDALEGVQDAQENLTDAQENSADAQRDLDQATSDYAETLAGLQSDAAGAADDVLSAEIRLRKARQALAELGKDGDPVSSDDRLEAEIAIREAERRLEAARQAALDAAAEVDRNDDGAATSEAVVAASEAVTTAKEDEAAAQEALEGAVQNVADTQVAANEAVALAEENLAEKIEAVQAAQQRRIDARQSVIDAQGQVQKAAEGVRDAEAEVRDRLGEVGKAQGELNDAADATVTARGKVEVAEGKLGKKVEDHAIAQGLLALNAANSGVALGGAFASGMQSALDKFDPNDPKVKTMKALLTAFILLGGGANGGIGGAAAGVLGDLSIEDLLRTSAGGKGKGSKSSDTLSTSKAAAAAALGAYLGVDPSDPAVMGLLNMAPTLYTDTFPGVSSGGSGTGSNVTGTPFKWGEEVVNNPWFKRSGAMSYDPNIKPPTRNNPQGDRPPIEINVHGVKDPEAIWAITRDRAAAELRMAGGRR